MPVLHIHEEILLLLKLIVFLASFSIIYFLVLHEDEKERKRLYTSASKKDTITNEKKYLLSRPTE